jgi:hypothetical protein
VGTSPLSSALLRLFVALEQRAGADDSVETPTRNGGAGKVSSEPYPVNDGWWTAVTATRNQTIPQ